MAGLSWLRHVPGEELRVPVLPGPIPVRLGLERPEYLRPSWLAEMTQTVGWRPEISDLPAWHQYEQSIADIEVRDAVCYHDDRPPFAGEAGHHLHHGHVQAGVQP